MHIVPVERVGYNRWQWASIAELQPLKTKGSMKQMKSLKEVVQQLTSRSIVTANVAKIQRGCACGNSSSVSVAILCGIIAVVHNRPYHSATPLRRIVLFWKPGCTPLGSCPIQ